GPRPGRAAGATAGPRPGGATPAARSRARVGEDRARSDGVGRLARAEAAAPLGGDVLVDLAGHHVQHVAVDRAAEAVVRRRRAAEAAAVAGLAHAAGGPRLRVGAVRVAVAHAAALVGRVALVVHAVAVRIGAGRIGLALPGRIAAAAGAALGVAAG